MLVHSKFSSPFDGMFGGGKGGDSDAARRAIEVRVSILFIKKMWFCLNLRLAQHSFRVAGKGRKGITNLQLVKRCIAATGKP